MPVAPKMFTRGSVAGWLRRAGHFLACTCITLGALPALAQRPIGVDVSDYQGTINWVNVKNAGVSFAWAKATEGAFSNENTFTNNQNNAAAAGVYIGAYHFAHPELHPGTSGAQQEAQHFWFVSRNWIKTGGTRMQPMVDMESDLTGFGFTKTSLSQWVNDWCNYLVAVARTNGVTVKPIIYTGASYASTWMNTTVTNHPIWMASYPSSPDPQTGHPSGTNPWTMWNFWQYTGSNTVAGATHGWDGDVYNGTSNTLVSFLIGGVGPPSFNSEPLHRAVDAGSNITFTAVVLGSPPLKYQWQFNGTNIPTGLTNTLTITNAQATNAGYYAVIITNSFGALTSSPASLLVYPRQGNVFADNFEVNTATNWIYNKSSADTAVTFNFDYSALGIPSAPQSAAGTTRGLQMKANLAAGAVSALSLSPTNQIFAGDYRIHFDAWINVNGPLPAGGSGSTEFLTAGVGTAGNRTEWTGNASADGCYFSIDGEGGIGDTQTGAADVNAYIGPTVQLASTGIYWAGTDVTARGNLNDYYTTAFPFNAFPPTLQQTTYPVQQNGSLADGTFGLAWHDVIVSKRGTTVDWVVDGFRFVTISNTTLTASNVFVGFWDPFTSLSASNAINFGLVDNVRVESPAYIPAFTLQPVDRTVKLGTNVTFTASANGLPAATYQWRFNGTNILGATNANYTLAFVGTTNTGNYSVSATNFMGGITSTNAALTLAAPVAPQFSAAGLTVDGGGAVQINFAADAYWTYTVEVSTNLTDWNVLTNLTSANGAFSFTAGSAADSPQQFYRVRTGP